jgi:streptomycin 6-kinase
MGDIFAPYLILWNLVPDGAPIVTTNSHLMPVRHQDEAPKQFAF